MADHLLTERRGLLEDRQRLPRVESFVLRVPLRAGVALPACTGQDVSLCVNRTSPPDVLPREALR